MSNAMVKMRAGKLGISGVVISTLFVLSSCGEPRATAPSSTSQSASSSSPTLVECPTNETLTGLPQTVGPLGGTVSLGGDVLSIPLNAVTVPTLFQITVPASRFMEIDVNAVGFQTFSFQDSVSITIDYSRCNRSDLNQQTLHVWHIDPVTKALLEDMGGVDDKANQRITFKTNHLSGYAVAN